MLLGRVGRPGLGTIEKIWMIGALSQMHQNIHQPHFTTALVATSIQNVDILEKNLFVPVLLHLRHRNVDVDHFLWQEGLFYVGLFGGQKESFQMRI